MLKVVNNIDYPQIICIFAPRYNKKRLVCNKDL